MSTLTTTEPATHDTPSVEIGHLRAELVDRTSHHALPSEARDRLGQLLTEGTARDLRSVLRHLRALDRSERSPEPPLTSEEREVVHTRLDELVEERTQRVEAHRRRTGRLALSMGRRVARGEVTVETATRRLNEVAHALDPDIAVPIFILPWAEAEEIALHAYADGVRDARGSNENAEF